MGKVVHTSTVLDIDTEIAEISLPVSGFLLCIIKVQITLSKGIVVVKNLWGK